MNTVEQLRNFIIDNYFNDCSEYLIERIRKKENLTTLYFEFPSHTWTWLRICRDLGDLQESHLHELNFESESFKLDLIKNLLKNKKLPDNLRNEIILMAIT